jgi:hypothetical protein
MSYQWLKKLLWGGRDYEIEEKEKIPENRTQKKMVDFNFLYLIDLGK